MSGAESSLSPDPVLPGPPLVVAATSGSAVSLGSACVQECHRQAAVAKCLPRGSEGQLLSGDGRYLREAPATSKGS